MPMMANSNKWFTGMLECFQAVYVQPRTGKENSELMDPPTGENDPPTPRVWYAYLAWRGIPLKRASGS